MEPRDVTYFESPGHFREWLEAHHGERDDLWVGYWKKATQRSSLTWEESVDEALCFGWIDGIRKRVDEHAYTIRFTQRRAGSTWSVRNIARYAELRRTDRIEPAGAAAYLIRTEENSGTYAYEQAISTTLSREFLAQLSSNDAAWTDWQSRPPGYREQVSHWIMSAKREATRERRLATLIEDSAAARKVKPLR